MVRLFSIAVTQLWHLWSSVCLLTSWSQHWLYQRPRKFNSHNTGSQYCNTLPNYSDYLGWQLKTSTYFGYVRGLCVNKLALVPAFTDTALYAISCFCAHEISCYPYNTLSPNDEHIRQLTIPSLVQNKACRSARHQAIMWTCAIYIYGTLGNEISVIWITETKFSIRKIACKCRLQNECRQICRVLNELTLNVRGPSYLRLIRSISWLVMPWLLTSAGHQQPCYWLCRICGSWSYMRRDFKYLCHINGSSDIKCKYMLIFPMRKSAGEEIIMINYYILRGNNLSPVPDIFSLSWIIRTFVAHMPLWLFESGISMHISKWSSHSTKGKTTWIHKVPICYP